MSKRNWIPVKAAEGVHSRQAHADMPDGTYEREASKEGFFGPAAFFHHPRPPTGWSNFEGPLRPRAFDLNGLNEAQSSPWDAPVVLKNAATGFNPPIVQVIGRPPSEAGASGGIESIVAT